MTISIFNLFSIGIGPSSSHTVGPMRASNAFIEFLKNQELLAQVHELKIDLYGSLALTGRGHGTDKAILNGLEGQSPESVDPDTIGSRVQTILQENSLKLANNYIVPFIEEKHLLFHQKESLPKHPNGLIFTAYDKNHQILSTQTYYSIGGGFIVTDEEFGQETQIKSILYPFRTAEDLMNHCKNHKLQIWELMLENEKVWHTESQIRARLLKIAQTMEQCINKGMHAHGTLPGFLKVRRRAPALYDKLIQKGMPQPDQYADIMNWLNIFAMAVNEENAAGGRVVTAPTNGAAGIVPAVLQYYKCFVPGANEEGVIQYLLTAGAIAVLYKLGASISGAEVGCQGEVGSASSMAAGALAAVLGGSLEQIENAAEIAMEHHLGMTCDPVGGFVQIPCIERNAMGAVKSVNAARLALLEDGQHKVSLDKVIKTMYQTGKDMMSIYKETSQGGLAVNVTEC